MHSIHARRRPPRAGLTILEFVGCLIAVVGGLWLGALYLGFNVQSAAYTALSESQLLDKMPEGWRPQPSNDNAMTREQLVGSLREEFGTLRTEITALRTGKSPSAAGDASNIEHDTASHLPAKERTLAYWLRLNEIALGEAALQEDAESAFNPDNAAKVFAVKGRTSRFAAKAVEAVPTTGVEEAAVRFGRALALWYNHGGELYENATQIWETPIGPQARTQLNQEWKQAEEHYRNEARLLHKKASAVRSSMSRIYGEQFPEFATSAQ